MTDFRDPPRLFELEETPTELRSWLDRAHHDILSATQIEQVVQAVESLVGTAAPSGPGPTGSALPVAPAPAVGSGSARWTRRCWTAPTTPV